MGGPGSGRWYRWQGTRTTLDEVNRLDVRWLQRHGYLDGQLQGVAWSCRGQDVGALLLTVQPEGMVLTYRCRVGERDWEIVRQVVTLDWVSCQYGGQRPWFRCPGCQRRVAVLCSYDQLFLCRHCYRLPYTSQHETRLDRLSRKLRKLQTRIGHQYARKPKGMHWRTWERLRDQALHMEMTRDLAMEAMLDRLMRRG